LALFSTSALGLNIARVNPLLACHRLFCAEYLCTARLAAKNAPNIGNFGKNDFAH
jgi:hypothetical protein